MSSKKKGLYAHLLVAEGRLFFVCDSAPHNAFGTLTRVANRLREMTGIKPDPTWLGQVDVAKRGYIIMTGRGYTVEPGKVVELLQYKEVIAR